MTSAAHDKHGAEAASREGLRSRWHGWFTSTGAPPAWALVGYLTAGLLVGAALSAALPHVRATLLAALTGAIVAASGSGGPSGIARRVALIAAGAALVLTVVAFATGNDPVWAALAMAAVAILTSLAGMARVANLYELVPVRWAAAHIAVGCVAGLIVVFVGTAWRKRHEPDEVTAATAPPVPVRAMWDSLRSFDEHARDGVRRAIPLAVLMFFFQRQGGRDAFWIFFAAYIILITAGKAPKSLASVRVAGTLFGVVLLAAASLILPDRALFSLGFLILLAGIGFSPPYPITDRRRHRLGGTPTDRHDRRLRDRAGRDLSALAQRRGNRSRRGDPRTGDLERCFAGDRDALGTGDALAPGGGDAHAADAVARPVVGEHVDVAVAVTAFEVARVGLECDVPVVGDVGTAACVVRHPTAEVVARATGDPAPEVANEHVGGRMQARPGVGEPVEAIRPGEVGRHRAPRDEPAARGDRRLRVAQVARLAGRVEAHHPRRPPAAVADVDVLGIPPLRPRGEVRGKRFEHDQLPVARRLRIEAVVVRLHLGRAHVDETQRDRGDGEGDHDRSWSTPPTRG